MDALVAARGLQSITDDVAYLKAASVRFDAFLLDTTFGRRNYGSVTPFLNAIQSFTMPGDHINPRLIAFFFNSAQKEALRLLRPQITAADLAIYFPPPPTLIDNAQDILQRMDQPLLLRALAQRAGGGGRGGRGRGGGRGRRSRFRGGNERRTDSPGSEHGSSSGWSRAQSKGRPPRR